MTHQFEDHQRHFGAVSPPVYLNSLHLFPTFEDYLDADPAKEDCYIYGRVSNPTLRLLERKLAALENGREAAVFSSGMAAATSAILAVCKAGDHILCMRDIYQPVKRFMASVGTPKLGISLSYVSGLDLEEIGQAIRPNTKLMSLTLRRPPEDAVRFINKLRLFGKGCSWGGFESLALCPLYRASDEEMAFLNLHDRGLIRLHCGLEGETNLLEDLSQALDAI